MLEKIIDHTIVTRKATKADKAKGLKGTIGVPIKDYAETGSPYDLAKQTVKLSMSETYNDSIILNKNETWVLPQGAFKEGGGPT